MLEIQLEPPFSDRVQELAAANHTSVQDWIQGIIVQESAHHAMATERLRELLLKRHQEVLDGKTIGIDTAFERIKNRLK